MNSLENTKEIKVQRFNLGHMIKNLLLYFLLLGWTVLIFSVSIPLDRLSANIPTIVTDSIVGTSLTLLNLIVIYKLFGKRYSYLFRVDPLKQLSTYAWIFGTLTLVVICLVLFTEYTGIHNYSSNRSYVQFGFLFLQVVLLVPIVEELIFRGFLLLIPHPKLKYLMFVVSTLSFAMIHENPEVILWLSLGFGTLAIRFNNLWVPIIAHMLWNLFASFFAFTL